MTSDFEPLISIVVPAYNRADLIGETVSSILAQSYLRWELVVVDDGSTDGTAEAVARAGRGDSRVRCVRQANSERAVARNRGIREARGEWVAFLDSDDLWLPTKLERQVEVVHRDDSDCCYCLFEVLGDIGKDVSQGESPAEKFFHSC